MWEHRGTQEALWAFSRLTDWFRVLPRPSWKRQKSTEPPEQTASRAQEDRASFDREEAIRREQEAREAEARARRAQAEEEAKATAGQGMASSPDDQRTHEEVLGLKSPWTQDDLKAAYRREAQRLHPDKWIGKPEPIRQAMEAEYKKVQEAFRYLKA